jgi:glucose dehydrogenase
LQEGDNPEREESHAVDILCHRVRRGAFAWERADAGACRRHDPGARAQSAARAAELDTPHHGNYQGHRFSLLKEINTETVKNLKPAFTVALSGFQSGGRYAAGNLEATPLVEDGFIYVPDGWGSV